MNIAGVVILYNPDENVINNIKSYLEELDCLYVFDNTETANEILVEKIKCLPRVRYISFCENKGISFALNTVLSAVYTGEFFPKEAWISFAENTALLLYFNLGVLFCLSGMGRAIGKGTAFGKKYTRILIPSFVFILFADIFFTIISLLQGGIFRGWLAKKE